MNIGDDLIIKVNAYNPLTGDTTSNSTLTINAYNPAKNPRTSDADRAAPDHTATLGFDTTLLAYYGVIPTTGWTAGTWTLQTAITGELVGHDYRTVTLVDG